MGASDLRDNVKLYPPLSKILKLRFHDFHVLLLKARKYILRSDKEILQSKLKKFLGNKLQYYNDESGLQLIKSYVTTNVLYRNVFRIEFVVCLIYIILSFHHFFFQILFQDNKSTWFIIMKQDHRSSVNYSSKELLLKSQSTLQASCFPSLLLTFFLTFIIYKMWFINLGLVTTNWTDKRYFFFRATK